MDDEGEVLDLVMQRERDTGAALKLLRRLFRNQPVEPTAIVTDGLTSYGSALRELGQSASGRSSPLGPRPKADSPPCPRNDTFRTAVNVRFPPSTDVRKVRLPPWPRRLLSTQSGLSQGPLLGVAA